MKLPMYYGNGFGISKVTRLHFKIGVYNLHTYILYSSEFRGSKVCNGSVLEINLCPNECPGLWGHKPGHSIWGKSSTK